MIFARENFLNTELQFISIYVLTIYYVNILQYLMYNIIYRLFFTLFPQTVWTHLGVLTVGVKQLMLRSLKRAGVCG